ncbi:MAG: HAD hydrolase-like protein [Candidatus Doudnabacteria bacterium]|nr:HAD hydrolase-like protein [Candidatus Doudnabacteria bacterium]
MIKALLIDGDGATIKKTKYFSDVYAEEYHLPEEKLRPFFKDKFRLCQRGKADLKQEVTPYLKGWGWKGTVDEFLDYWFHTQTIPNQPVLDFLKDIRERGIKCYMVSDQEKYRANYITNNLRFKDYFDDLYYSCDIGFSKSQKEFFEIIIKRLNLKPEEILYWDDEDIEMAKEVGINASVFTSFENFKEEVGLLLNI